MREAKEGSQGGKPRKGGRKLDAGTWTEEKGSWKLRELDGAEEWI